MLGITADDLKSGQDFKSAAGEFLEWCGEDYKFITWGGSDLTEFQRNMKYFGVENHFPFPLTYYDLQKLYSKVYSDGKTRRSLKIAIEELGFWKMQSIIQQSMMLYIQQESFLIWILTV